MDYTLKITDFCDLDIRKALYTSSSAIPGWHATTTALLLRCTLQTCGVPLEVPTASGIGPPPLASVSASAPCRLDRSVGGGRHPAHQLQPGIMG